MRIRVLFILGLGLVPVTELNGQSESFRDRLNVDLGVAFLGSVPDEFESNACGSLFGLSAEVGVGFELMDHLLFESSFSVSFLRPATCDAADQIPTPSDGSSTRRVFSDGIARTPFPTTTHRVVFDPQWPNDAKPRASLGVGRLWGKEAWFWSVGLGVHIPFVSSSTRIEVERMGFGLGFSEETTVWSGGEVVGAYTSPKMEQRESMWAFRLRVPVYR